jgi:uncharacterized protein
LKSASSRVFLDLPQFLVQLAKPENQQLTNGRGGWNARLLFTCLDRELTMQALRSLIALWPDAALSIAGLVIGMAFGALLAATNYCVMGAVSDWRLSGSMGRLGAAAVAAATAITTAQFLATMGIVDLSKSIYLGPRINWAGAIGGGLLFGMGMVYAGGCPSRALVRAGGGDVRGMIVLVVLAIAAYATISGVFGNIRVALDNATAIDVRSLGVTTQGFAELLRTTGLSASLARLAAAAVVTLPLLAFAFGTASIGSQSRCLMSGIGVGLLAASGWLVTGLASDELASNPMQPTSLSFVRPVADAVDWIERSTALGLPGFGASSVFGVIAGSFFSRLLNGGLQLTAFASSNDLKRHLAGAIAMGIGGVLALGCSIGQGVTGISTLSIQSLIACVAIIAGAVLGLNMIEREL